MLHEESLAKESFQHCLRDYHNKYQALSSDIGTSWHGSQNDLCWKLLKWVENNEYHENCWVSCSFNHAINNF